MAINTAALTSSGRATISSCAMNAPIDAADDAHRRGVELLDQRGRIRDHGFGRETVGVFRRSDTAVVEGDAAIAGPLELGHLVQVPGAARAATTRDEQHRVAATAVVVGQIHADDAT